MKSALQATKRKIAGFCTVSNCSYTTTCQLHNLTSVTVTWVATFDVTICEYSLTATRLREMLVKMSYEQYCWVVLTAMLFVL